MYEEAIRITGERLSALHSAYAIRAFFLLATSTIIIVNNIPALRSRFLAYGPRVSHSLLSGKEDEKGVSGSPGPSAQLSHKAPNNSVISKILDEVARLTVPHSWFEHFYIVSLFFSLYWAIQFISAGRLLKGVISRAPVDTDTRSVSQEQVLVTWALMTIQGSRRLYECVALLKPSQARMWVVHWLLGVGFYIAMSMAVWIEGIPVLGIMKVSLDLFTLTPPTLRTCISILLFIFASGIQHDCHTYLASLPKYTLPKHPAFASLICPHYTAECIIYLSLTLIAAPKGAIVNKTIFSALIFVVTNLGVTAEMSREWHVKKFGPESVKGKRRMIPLVF